MSIVIITIVYVQVKTRILLETELKAGRTFPLGQSFYVDSHKTELLNFALYSQFSDYVSLYIFRKSNLSVPVLAAEKLDYRTHKTNRTWHVAIPKEYCMYSPRIDGGVSLWIFIRVRQIS